MSLREEALIASFKKALIDSSFSDLKIVVGKETLNAHRCIVGVRCEEICPLPDLSDKKKKIKDKSTVTIKAVTNPQTMMKVLEFIYSGTVAFPSMAPEAIMELNKAAKHFNLKRLSYSCENFFQQNLSMSNIFHVLKAAHTLNEPTVKAFCKFFAIEHFNEFVMNTEGLHVLGIDLFQEIVTAYLTSQATQSLSKVSLGEPPAYTLFSDYERMYKLMPYSDCKVFCDGEEFVCHKSVLASSSEKFKALVSSSSSTIMINGISKEGFRSMLKFLYYGCDDIEPLPACELVAFCRANELFDLLTICENKIRNSIATNTVLGILEVAYQPEMAQKQDLVEELKGKTFPFVAENFTEIDLSPLRLKMNPKSVLIASDLLLYLQDAYKKSL